MFLVCLTLSDLWSVFIKLIGCGLSLVDSCKNSKTYVRTVWVRHSQGAALYSVSEHFVLRIHFP